MSACLYQFLTICMYQLQLQGTSYAQAQLQETSIQTELQRNFFEVEHLMYNKWCSQCKSDTDS